MTNPKAPDLDEMLSKARACFGTTQQVCDRCRAWVTACHCIERLSFQLAANPAAVIWMVERIRELEAQLADDPVQVGTLAWAREEMRQLGHECVNGAPREDCAACKEGQ